MRMAGKMAKGGGMTRMGDLIGEDGCDENE